MPEPLTDQELDALRRDISVPGTVTERLLVNVDSLRAEVNELRERNHALERRWNHTAALPHSPGGHKHNGAIPLVADLPHFEHHYWEERREAEVKRLTEENTANAKLLADRDALLRVAEAARRMYARHDLWCGYYREAPGDSSHNEFRSSLDALPEHLRPNDA